MKNGKWYFQVAKISFTMSHKSQNNHSNLSNFTEIFLWMENVGQKVIILLFQVPKINFISSNKSQNDYSNHKPDIYFWSFPLGKWTRISLLFMRNILEWKLQTQMHENCHTRCARVPLTVTSCFSKRAKNAKFWYANEHNLCVIGFG